MNRRYYLPPTTTRLLTEERVRRCKNLGLILDKYIPEEAIQKSEGKGIWLKTLDPDSRVDGKLAESVYQRWLNTIQSVNAQSFSAFTDWRIVVGLGGETVLETDLTLHHLYGIPFIPGSALKGLTRAYATSEKDEGHLSKKIEEDDETIQRIFGSQDRAGSVVFFDAMPINGKVAFDIDIMNAHYPDYYGQNKLPTNDQNPNPVTFLTVTETIFMFALSPRSKGDEADVAQAKEWLKKALSTYGVGGKTSAGYGYFTNIRDEQVEVSAAQTTQTSASSVPPAPPVDPQIKQAEGYKKEIDALRDVAGQINGYYQRWKQLTSPEAQLIVARAIVEKVRQAGREKGSAEKAWYKELLTFLDASGK